MFFMLFGIGCWFLSDGYIYWPNEAERYEQFTKIADELIESGEAEDAESTSVRMAWQRYAKEADLKAKLPKERTDAGIREQRVIGWVMTTGALLFVAWVAWNHTRSVRVEGEEITGASGEVVEIDQIIAVDRKKWKNKGIAYGIYEVNGKQKRLCLDDHKFVGCEAIILEAERRIKERKEQA